MLCFRGGWNSHWCMWHCGWLSSVEERILEQKWISSVDWTFALLKVCQIGAKDKALCQHGSQLNYAIIIEFGWRLEIAHLIMNPQGPPMTSTWTWILIKMIAENTDTVQISKTSFHIEFISDIYGSSGGIWFYEGHSPHLSILILSFKLMQWLDINFISV